MGFVTIYVTFFEILNLTKKSIMSKATKLNWMKDKEITMK